MLEPVWLKRLRSARERRTWQRRRRNRYLQLGITRLEERRVLDAAGLVADINPDVASSQPTEFAQFNGNLYFAATGIDGEGTFVGRELYQVDAAGGVSLVSDINPGAADSSPSGFTTFNGSLYFAATSGDGRELFKIDTAGLVTQIADINAGVADSSPDGFTAFNGSLYFAAMAADGRELFKLDTSENVSQVDDINDGTASSNPEGFTEYDGKLYFAATAAEGRELFVLNRGDNVNQIADINAGLADANPDEFVVFNDFLYFVATSGTSRTLYRQNPSGVNPAQILDPALLANPAELTVFDGNLYFRAENLQGDSELFFLDADEAITTVFSSDGDPLGFPSTFTHYNGTLYFAADTDAGRSLFRLDTTTETIAAVEIPLPAGTTLAPGEPAELAEFPLFAGDLYFSAMGPLGSELYRVDPSDDIQLVTDINVGPSGSDPADFIVFGNAMYFAATTEQLGRELYRVIPSPSTLEIVGDALLFTDVAGDFDNRLVVSSDGTLLRIVDENGHEIASSIPGVTGVGTSEVFIPLANLGGVDRLVVDTRGGDDSLTLDLSSSAAAILAQFPAVAFDGGTNHALTRGDVLRLVGDTTTEVIITPDAAVPGAGLATIVEDSLSTQLTFVGLEPVDVTGMAQATLLLPGTGGGDDDLTITDGVDALDASAAALVVNGSTAGTAIESVHFFANEQIVVDASAGDDGNDHVLLSGASSAHANVHLRIDIGQAVTTGNDVVEVTGDVVLAGDFEVVGGRFTLASSVLVGGTVDVAVQEHIALSAQAVVSTSGAGSVRLIADSDQSGNEALSMADGSLVESQLGEIVLEAGGNVLLAQASTGNDGAQAIRVVSRQGDIVDGGDSGGADLVATAPGAVVILQAAGSVGNAATGAIDTQVSSIDALAGTGDILLNEQDDLIGFRLVALFGLVDVRADGNLLDTAGDSDVDVTADRALLVAAQIGDAANPIETQVQRLEADAGPGSLWITGDGDLVIGDVSGLFAGITAAQAISLTNDGALAIIEAIESAQGPITLSATDGVSLSSSVTSGGGRIEVSSGSDLTFTSTALVDAALGTAGVLLEAVDAIQMADLSVIDGRDGDVTLTAGGNITLSDVRTTAQIQVTSGAAILDTFDAGGVDLTASSALLTAAAGIGTSTNPLETTLSQLEADAGAAGLWIGNQGNLQLGGLSPALTGITAGHAISLATVGTLTILEKIDSAQGPITLVSTGELSLSSSITSGGGRIEITSDAGIDLSATAVIDTEQGSAGILLDAADAIDLAHLSLVQGRDGDVVLIAGSDITLSDVRTTAGIQATAGSAILDAADAGNVDLTADTLQLVAVLGIGTSANPLETAVANLEADAGIGGFWLINQGDLDIGNVTVALQGIRADQIVSLQNFGNLLVSEDVTAALGPLTLTADGTVTVADAVTSGSGFLQIDSTGDLTLTETASVEVQQGTAGIFLQSGASIDMNDGSLVLGADGLIAVQAAGNVTLSDLRTTAQIEVVSGGAILDTADAGGADLTASSALLTAAAGIGTAANPIETMLSQLEADAGTGSFWLDNQGNLEIGDVSPQLTGIAASQAITLSTAGTLSITEAVDSDQGPITLSATDDLELISSITSGGGAVALDSGGDIALATTALIDAEQGAAGIILEAAETIQLADLSIIEGRDGDVSLTAAGDVTLSDIRTTARIRVTSGGAILDTADAGGVDLTASSALLSSAAGIGTPANPLETALPQLEVDAGAGGLWLTNTGAAQIGGISDAFTGITADQAIVLIHEGTLSITETIDSAQGPITVSATDDLSLSSSITSGGGRIEISSGGSVALSPAALIDVEQGSTGVRVEATGTIELADLSLIDGRDGDVTLIAGGDITLSDVRTTAQIQVTSGGAILDTADGGGTDLTAGSALLMAAAGIGTAVNPLETTLSQLESDAGSGGLWLDNQANLEVGGVSPLFTGMIAAQDIALSTVGTLIITETIDSGQGPITLSSTDDLSLSSSITSGGGRIEVIGGDDIALTPIALIDTQTGPAGILLQASGAIRLDNGSVIQARDGDMHLEAGGDVILSDLRTSTFVQIESGGAILDTDDSGGLDITADRALLIAAVAIGSAANPIETQINRLEANSAPGGVWLNNVVELTIGGTFAGDNVEIVAAGGIAVVEMLITGGGNLLLDAGGTIRVLDQVTTDGGSVFFDTDGDLLFSPDGSIDAVTGSAGIVFQVAGQVVMEDGSSVNARDGDVAISAGGSVTLSDVRTTAGMSITSGGAILDTNDGAGVDLTASTASLVSATGIGAAANPLETMLSHLEADAGAGGLWMSNQGDLEVGGVSAALTGIAAAQAIALSNTGTLTITEAIDSAQGPVTLSATDDLSLSSSMTSGGGPIEITSGGDITLASTGHIDAELGTAGILLEATGAIQLDHLSFIDGRDGDVTLSAGGDVTLSELRTTAQAQVTSGGAILDTTDAGGVDITAASALLSAALGIGTPANPLETALSQLEADAGAGGFWLSNQGTLEVGGVSPLFSGIAAGQAITLANTGTLIVTEEIDSEQGPITVSSTDDLSLSSTVTSGGGRIELSSDGDLALSPAAVIDTEQSAAGILLDANESIELADLSLVQGRDGNVTLIAGGNVTLSDVRTTTGIQVTAGGAIADTDDAAGADLTASDIQLTSTLGIGSSSNPLESTVSRIEADAGTGDFWLVNQGALEVGGVTATLQGIAAAGTVFLHNVGDLSTTEAVGAAQGPLTLTAEGTLTVAASVTSGSGFLQIDSTGNLSLTASAIVEVQQGTAGMLLESDAAIAMSDGSLVQGADGTIALIAMEDVTLSDLRTTALVQVTSGSTILDTADAGGVDVTAGTVLLTAASGIGTPANPLETAVPLLEANAGAGGLWLDNQGDLQVGGVSNSFSGITAADTIALSTTGTLTVNEAIVGSPGPIVLSAVANLTISSSITSGGGRIELSSAAQVILGAGSHVDVESGAAGVLITGATGIQMAAGSTIFGRDGGVSLSTEGPLTLAQIITTADVSLQAAQVTDANGSLLNIAAMGLTIDAASIGQPGAAGAIDTSVDSLTASASTGSIFLLEQDGVFLEDLTASADIQLASSTGTIVVASVSAGNQVSLTAAAAINDDTDNATTIAANVLVLDAGQGIGLTGDPATAQLDTATGELVVTSALGFDVSNSAADLLLSQAVATSDQAFGRVTNSIGHLLVGVVTLSGANTTLHLQTPAGSVLDANAGALNLTATHLGLLANDGVGTAADPLETNVRQVEILAQNGSVFLSNSGTVEIADLPGFIPSEQGISAFGGINLFATGTILLAQPLQVTGPGAVAVTSNQGISLASLIFTSAGAAAINAAGDIFASSSAVLDVQGGDLQLTADHDGNGSGTIQFFGNIEIDSGNAVFNLPAPDGLMAGAVSGSGGLVKQGAGTLFLSETSVNSYTGMTLIQAGTLIVDGQIGSLGPAGTVVLSALTTLSGTGDINAPIFSNAVSAKIISSGNLSLGDGSPAGFDFAGQLLIGDGHFVTLRDADLAELGVMTLLGFGSTLSAPNGVEITDGEQLGGNGLVDGDVFVRTGGQTSAGLSTGILTTRDLDLNAGATFLVEINGITPGTTFDQFNVLGDVSVAGAQLAVTGIRFRPSAGTEFVILNNDGLDPIVGQFVNTGGQLLAEGATVTFNGIQTILSYVGGDSNDVSLTVTEVPLFFVPDSGGETRIVLTASIVAALGLDLDGENEVTTTAALARETVQAPPNQTVIEFRTDDLQIEVQQSLRIYFKVVNDALQEEWSREYDLPVERYAEGALAEAINYFRNRRFPSGHYRVYILEPGDAQPRILADIHIQEGKIVPPNYREEPEQAAPEQALRDDSDTDGNQTEASAAEGVQPPDDAPQTAPPGQQQPQGDADVDEGARGETEASEPRSHSGAAAVLGVVSTAALTRERVHAALGASAPRVSRAARLLRRLWSS